MSDAGGGVDYPPARPDPRWVSVEKQAANLLKQCITMKKFDESTGSVDYRRFSQEFRMRVRAAGDDFLAALLYDGEIAACAPYDATDVTSNSLDTITTLTLPQLRQQSLIAALRACFVPEGEAERLTRECVHAGGILMVDPQAWIILKTRWFTSERPKAVGAISAMLFSKPFPQELSVELYLKCTTIRS